MPILCGPVAYDGGFPGLKSGMDPKERFYRHFEAQATVLQDDIANLSNLAVTGGERKDATDHILSGISRLTNEVSDASEYAPPRDQMIYTQALKALREQLGIQTSRLGSRSRFSFSSRSKETFLSSSPNSSDATLRSPGGRQSDENDSAVFSHKGEAEDDALGDLPTFRDDKGKNYNAEMASQPGLGIRKPSFSGARDIDISSHQGMHIILPATASRATSSGSVKDLRGCILDMSVPTMSSTGSKSSKRGSKASPFASLTIKGVGRSLIIAGHVTGPAHITGVRDSVLVVNARQVRIHECKNITVWLWCGSHPIIENSEEVRFAKIPGPYLTDGQDSTNNQWNQVDDFNWLKAEASPNWRTLSDQDKEWVPAQFWETTVRGGPQVSTEEILRQAGVTA